MTSEVYSQRLGSIQPAQFQAALDRFDLGTFVRAEAIPFGLFGQNVFVTSTKGAYVLRGTAHYDWQLPKEQFIARLLHEQASVPTPWPYEVDTDESIFGWLYGYALMPRMPGSQLADPAVANAFSFEDRREIARALGEMLAQVHGVHWPFAGAYDLKSATIQAFPNGFETWIVEEIRGLMRYAVSFDTGTSAADQAWVETVIEQTRDALAVPFTLSLVLHDYKEGNVTVEQRSGRWQVSGVFDLMEAIMADGEMDLVRQTAAYLDAGQSAWASAFVAAYTQAAPLRPLARERLLLYLVYDRLIIWTYFHQPHIVSQWGGPGSFQAWVEGYQEAFKALPFETAS